MNFCKGDLVEVKGYTGYCVVTHAGRFSSNVQRGADFIYDVPNGHLKKDDEAAAVKAAKVEEIKKLKRLLEATGVLLNDVDDLVTARLLFAQPSVKLAEHLTELQPLANSLGYSIVLVGDNGSATLVQL